MKDAVSSDDIVKLLDTIMKLAVDMMNADRGAVLLREGDDLSTMATYSSFGEEGDPAENLSSSVVKQVLTSGAPVLTHDAQADPRFGEANSIILHQITSIICAPMYLGDEVIGVIYLDSRHDRQHFTEENLNFVSTFSRMAAIAVDYAFNYTKVFEEKQLLQSQAAGYSRFEDIIGKSPKMQEVFNMMRRVMNSDISVLLEGESGTGKEVVARALHFNGPRRDKLSLIHI